MEDLKVLNQRLADYYGSYDGLRPLWRIVLADNEVEKRWVTHTREGWELIHPEVQERKKYNKTQNGKYILERCVPVLGATDLVEKFSFEPIFTFQDKDGNFLPPDWLVSEIVIFGIYEKAAEAMHANQNGRSLYTHPLAGLSTEEQIAKKQQEIDAIKDYFFANDTKIGDQLAYEGAVVVPRNYESVN